MATTTPQRYSNYVDGEWTEGAATGTFDTQIPATGEVLGTFPRSTAEDVDHAVRAAKEAFESWRLTPAPQRGELLYRFAGLLAEHKQELTELMSR